MRHEDGRDVQFVVQPAEPAAQLLSHFGVERAKRLIEQQHLGFHGKSARQGDALALTARKLGGKPVLQPAELDEIQKLPHTAADLGFGRAQVARLNAQPKGDVLEDGHVAKQSVMLENETDLSFAHVLFRGVFAIEKNAAAVGVLQAGDDAQERRLSATGRAKQGHKFATGKIE